MVYKNHRSVSVCMACFNGGKYILEQLESIVNQVGQDDEIIIVDDCSSDNTIDLIRKLNDHRVKLLINEINLGVNHSFELAIKLAKNDIIMLADQDDIWIEGRLKLMVNKFQDYQVLFVAGNSKYINSYGKEISPLIGNLRVEDSKRSFTNLWRIFRGSAPYYGCAIAFSKELKHLTLPFPDFIESHDLWIAKCAIAINRTLHVNEPLLFRRIHGSNASVVNRKFIFKIYSRLIFLLKFITVLIRILKKKNASFIK